MFIIDAHLYVLISHTYTHMPIYMHTLLFLFKVLKRNETILSNIADHPSSAILTVYLDKAEALPVSTDVFQGL